MANLEDHAIQRDKGFIVKLVVALILGALAGIWAMQQLTSDRTASTGASMFGYTTDAPAETPAAAPAH